MSPFVLTLIILAVLVVAGLLFLALCVKKCPADKVMVVFGAFLGKDAEGKNRLMVCQHGGAKLVLPFFQGVFFLDLNPISINPFIIEPWPVEASLSVVISTQPELMQNAAKVLLGQSPARIGEAADCLATEQLRLAAENRGEKDLSDFCASYCQALEFELNQMGLTIINFKIRKFQPEG